MYRLGLHMSTKNRTKVKSVLLLVKRSLVRFAITVHAYCVLNVATEEATPSISPPPVQLAVPVRKDSIKVPSSPSAKRTSLPHPPRALPSVPQPGASDSPRPSISSATRPVIPPPPVVFDQHAGDILCEAEDVPPEPPRRPSAEKRRSTSSAHAPHRSMPPVPAQEIPVQPEVEEPIPPPPPVRRTSLNAPPPKRQSVPPPPPPVPVLEKQEYDEQAYGDDEAGQTTTEPSDYSEAEIEAAELESMEEEQTPPVPPPPARRPSVPVPPVPQSHPSHRTSAALLIS